MAFNQQFFGFRFEARNKKEQSVSDAPQGEAAGFFQEPNGAGLLGALSDEALGAITGGTSNPRSVSKSLPGSGSSLNPLT